jgi:hypothetical protein
LVIVVSGARSESWSSIAPMSVPSPPSALAMDGASYGRGWPRWSVVAVPALPWSIAGLVAAGFSVWPALFSASGPSWGSLPITFGPVELIGAPAGSSIRLKAARKLLLGP